MVNRLVFWDSCVPGLESILPVLSCPVPSWLVLACRVRYVYFEITLTCPPDSILFMVIQAQTPSRTQVKNSSRVYFILFIYYILCVIADCRLWGILVSSFINSTPLNSTQLNSTRFDPPRQRAIWEGRLLRSLGPASIVLLYILFFHSFIRPSVHPHIRPFIRPFPLIARTCSPRLLSRQYNI